MGEKRAKNVEYWTCCYCDYKARKDILIEQEYMFTIKNDIVVCECPRCNSQQEVK